MTTAMTTTASLGAQSNDADCDGILTNDDCTDNDSSSTAVVNDADCDGVPTDDDCDDADPNAFENNGLTESCAALSCKAILDGENSIGDGLYWIDPVGFSTIQAYCDMSTDDGGWTRCGRYDESDGTTYVVEGDYRDHSSLLNESFCAAWYTNESPTEMMIHNKTPGSNYGEGDKLIVTWGSSPFTLYNYNNHPLQSCRMVGGTSWSTCWYAAHSSWDDTAFTVNGVGNGYGGNASSRLVLGPTNQPGASKKIYNSVRTPPQNGQRLDWSNQHR